MPKEPETRDRFRIFAETSAENMGPLLAQLTKMGLENIGYELITDVVTFKTRQNSGGDELARAWIAEHPEFKLSELSAHFMTHGRGQSSCTNNVRKLVRLGELVSLGDGRYRRSNPQLPAPQKVKQSAGSATGLTRAYMSTRKKITTSQIKELMVQNGKPASYAHPSIYQLVQLGELKRIGETGSGEYEVVQKQTSRAAAKKVNGANGAAHHA